MLLRAFYYLFIFDWYVSRGKFAALHRRIRVLPVAPVEMADAETRAVQAISTASIWYPRHALCLQRSAALVSLLRENGVRAELVIGATRMPMQAHAWVEIAGRAIDEKHDTQTKYMALERC